MDIDLNEFLSQIATTVKKMDRVSAQITLRMVYDMKFGLFNHQDPITQASRPLAAVAFHESQDALIDSLLEDTVIRYTDNCIYDVFHLTFTEYLEQPLAINLYLDEKARAVMKKRSTDLTNAQNEIQNRMNAMQQDK